MAAVGRSTPSLFLLAAGVVATTVLVSFATPVSARAGDGATTSSGDAGGPRSPAVGVFVSIAPQAYFVERIGTEVVAVSTLVGGGQSPHTFEPTPRQMSQLAESDVYFTVGLPFETRLKDRIQALNPDLRIVETARTMNGHGVPAGGEAGTLLGGPSGRLDDSADRAHQHDGHDIDPHTWLDPELAALQAEAIFRGLAAVAPNREDRFRANLDALLQDLAELDRELSDSLSPLAGGTLFVYHAAFGYFAHAYDLRQVAVETGGVEPGPRRLAELMDTARAKHARVIFVQPQFSRQTADAIAQEVGAVVVAIDPLAHDYIENLRSVAAQVRAALAEQKMPTSH